jgi:hypothetical protein
VIKGVPIPASETASTFCLIATISSSKSKCIAQAFRRLRSSPAGSAGPHGRGYQKP